MDLAEFLLARISEDEEVARAATAGPWEWDGENFEPRIVYGTSFVGIVGSGGVDIDVTDARHIARHDPARVLAECEAKRRIVEEYREWSSVGVSDTASTWGEGAEGSAALDTVLRLLALPYADHPDYRAEWRP